MKQYHQKEKYKNKCKNCLRNKAIISHFSGKT